MGARQGIGTEVQLTHEYINKVVCGDCRDLSLNIPDESVDMIFTDPLYHEKHRHYYRWLAETAVRVLKPGSWAFIYGGWEEKSYYDHLCIDGWEHRVTIALVNKAGYPRWWSKKVMVGYKPVYVFTKGAPRNDKWQSNIADSDRIDKRYSRYGQGIGFAIEKVDMFTEHGDIVFDPFCGGGQTAAACSILERNFITFDIEQSACEIARARLDDAQPPMTGFETAMQARLME